jgi:hypothetical protein
MQAVAATAILLSTAGVGDAASHGSGHAPAAVESEHADDASGRGIKLGEFHLRSYYPVEAQKSIIRFVLFATATGDDIADIRRLVRERQHRIRDQVITATRLVPLAELNSPDLKSLRRRILLRLRRTLPDLSLEDVYVSDFQLKVQSL